MDDESRKAIAREIEQLKDQLGTLANTSIAGRYIFVGTDTVETDTSGTDKQTPPYQNGNFVNTNTDKIKLEMGKGIYIEINTNGTELFGKSVNGKNIFQFLNQVESDLKNSNVQALDTHLSDLDQYQNIFLKVHASLGARENRLELIENRLDDQIVSTSLFCQRKKTLISQRSSRS